jgi:uncharacterized SAM-binding protein YcdF (DUF218 family)
MSSFAHPSREFWGVFIRRERWGLSWRGWLIVFAGVLLTFSLFCFRIYPFLATTDRVDADVLVVEGWVHRYAIRSAVEEFKTGSYQRILTTGGPVVGNGGYVNDYQTAAGVGADQLKKSGVPNEVVQMVPSHVVGRDRTYNSALALRDWLQDHRISLRSFNILTEDFHARRTRLLYEKVFGKDVAIGIIAIPSPDYDAHHWWRYSDGVREAVGESIAYLYAKFLFFPWEPAHPAKTARISRADR